MMLVITHANGPCPVPLATSPVSCIGANTKEKKKRKKNRIEASSPPCIKEKLTGTLRGFVAPSIA